MDEDQKLEELKPKKLFGEPSNLSKDSSIEAEDDTEDTKKNEESKIFSLYVRPSSRNRLGIVKKWLDLSYSDTLDLLLGHFIQEGLLPEEAIEELRDSGLFKDSDLEELALLGIYGRWSESAKLIQDLEKTNKLLSAQLEELINAIEDHAESIIINNKE